MKIVRIDGKRECEIPETWEEGMTMLNHAVAYHSGRGGNAHVLSVCARVAYGMLSDPNVTPDPTQALANLIFRICKRKGAGLA